jgi:hypothetical protein
MEGREAPDVQTRAIADELLTEEKIGLSAARERQIVQHSSAVVAAAKQVKASRLHL